jgi:hypothetical protein
MIRAWGLGGEKFAERNFDIGQKAIQFGLHTIGLN